MSSLETRENVYGGALGPDWASNLPIKGINVKLFKIKLASKF
jgi:hypothetical protein